MTSVAGLHNLEQFCFSFSVLEGCFIMDNLSIIFVWVFYMQGIHKTVFLCSRCWETVEKFAGWYFSNGLGDGAPGVCVSKTNEGNRALSL